MKQPNSASHGARPAKVRRKSREELNQEARDRKRQKKHRGHSAGSRANGGAQPQNGKSTSQVVDPRIGSKKPIPLGVTGAAVNKQHKQKSEKPMLTPQAELDMLENDEQLDALLERLEKGESLSKEEQSWVDSKLDRIDALMGQLGIAWDDEEEEEQEEKADDLMRLLKDGH